MPYIELPNKKYFKVPEGLSDDEALSLAKERFPKLYADTSKAKEGFIPSIKSGLEALTSAYGTAAAPIFDASDEAVRKRVEKSQARRSEIAKAPNWEDVTKAYEQYGVLGGEKPEERGALSSLLGMWRGQLGESLPQMGAIAAGARTGAGLGALTPVPGGTLIGGTLGALAASYPAFVGQNIERQVEEQEKAGAKQPLEFGRAAAAAAPQAALDVAETAFVLGRLGVGKLFSKELASLGTKKAEEELVKASQRSLAKTVGRGVVAGETIEIPTELAQQVLERWQAGLPLFDKGARDEYVGTAVGVAGPAGVFGGVGGVSRRSAAREELRGIQQARAEEQAKQQEQQRVAAEQAQQQREQFEALPPQTQTDIFGETAGAYTPLQGTKLPEGLETQQPEAALQEEYRKTRAEADRLSKIVDAATEQKNVPAYNAALQQLKQIDAAQAELIKVAKERGVILDVDAELKKAQASVQRYMDKQAPVPDALAQRLGALQTEQTRQAQQQAGVTPGPQMDLFDVPRMKAEDTARAEQFAQYMEEQPQFQPTQPAQPQLPAILQGMEDIEEQKRQTAEKERRTAAEQTRVRRLQELSGETALQRAEEQLQNPTRVLALAKAEGKDSALLRKRVDVINANIEQGGLTSDAVSLLGLKVPFEIKTQRPGLETETGLQYKYDLNDPRQAERLLPIIKTKLDAINTSQQKIANKNLYEKGVLTKSGQEAVVLEAKKRIFQRLIDIAKAPPKAPAKGKRPFEAKTNIAEANRAWNDNLFDFANNIDSLRKGTLEEADVGSLQEKTRGIKDSMIGNALNEIRARRAGAETPELTQAQTSAIIERLDAQFNRLIDVAPQSAVVKTPGEQRAGPTLLQKKFEEKGYPIRRGMTMGPSERTEFAKLRRDIEAVINKFAPSPVEKKAAKVTKPSFAKPTPKLAPSPTVSEAAVSDAVGALKTEAAKTLAATKQAKAAVTQAINKGLAENKTVAAILKDAQAAAGNGISPEGMSRVTALVKAAKTKPEVKRKAPIKPEAAIKEELAKIGEVGEARVVSLEVEQTKRELQKTIDTLEERVAAAPENKKLKNKLKKAKQKLSDILRQEEKALPVATEELKEQRRDDLVKRLVNKRLRLTAELAKAKKLSDIQRAENTRGKLSKRINEIKNKVAKLRSLPATKTFLASNEEVRAVLEDKRNALLKQAAELPAGPEKTALARKAENVVTDNPARTIADAIEALNAERIKLGKDRVAIFRAIKAEKVLPKELQNTERALKKLGYDVSMREAPAKTLLAQGELEGAARYAEAVAKTKRMPQTLKTGVSKEAKAPSTIKTRQKGKFGPTVKPVEKERKFVSKIKDPEGFADINDITGQERQAFMDYAQDAKFDRTDWRDATNADSGVAAKDAADVAARVAKALPKGVKFVYAPTIKDAPPAFLAALYRSGKTTAKGAVLPDGTVVVVGEAHKNTADLEETIAHELIGHYGVDTVLGPERMQALVDRLFKQGEAHVADVATALGVFPDVETALAGLGYTRPQVDLTRRRIVQAAGAALVTPTMPAKVAEVFNVPNDAAAVDAVFNVWNSADKWIGGLVEKLPVPLRKKAEDIVHENIYKTVGKRFYDAWSNQGETDYTVSILEDLVAEKGGAALLNKVKKAYDVAALDIVKLLPTETKVATEKESKQTETSHEQIKMSIVREMIAHAAEGRRVAPTFTEKVKMFVRDMVAAVRGWFRSSGLSDMAKRDAKEIQAIIRQASQDLAAGQLGVYTTPSGEVAFRPGEIDYPAGISASSRDLVDSLIYTKKGLLDRIKANVLGLAGVTQFVDRYAPVWAVLEKGVAGKKITDLEATQIRYNLSARDKVMNFVRLIAAQGPVEYKQKQDAKGAKFWMIEAKDANGANLVKMFEALGEANLDATVVGRLFTTWLGAQRVKNEGIGVEKLNFAKDENGNPIVTKQKLDKLEAEIDAMPQVKNAFEKARKIYNEYNKGLVDFAEQAGALSKEVADSLRSKKDFIPFYRPGAKGNIELVIGDEHPFVVGNLTDQPYLHELVGGDTAISDIFTSAVQNTHLMTDLALRNIATGSVADGLRKLGLLDTRKYKDKETGKDKEALRFSSDMKGSDTLRFRKDGEDVAVRVATDGTAFDGIDPALLVKGLEGVKTTMPAALQLFGVPSKVLRNFVVLSPTYPLRQVIKDSFSVLGTSGADFMPVITPFKNIAKAMSGTSREAALLESQGLLGGQVLGSGTSKDALSAVLRGVVSGKQNASSLLAWAEAKSMQADVGVRVASYNSFLKQGLNEIEAWVATNEIVDFNRRGLSPSVQWANTLYPFFNAQIQGLNVFAKALSGKMPYNERLKIRDKFIQRATLMAAMTVAYAMAMEDDEAYTNATPEQKLNNWFVRTPFFDEPVKIPIPFEFGLLAKAIPEAIYTALSGEEDMAPIGKALVGMGINSIPGMGNKFPQALLPFIEAYTGKDLFTGADVETAAMQRLDPAERYKENTTGLAKMLGSIGIPGVSPVKVDQFIKGIGSQTLLSMVSLTNALFETSTIEKAEAKASQLPFIGTSFQPNDAGGILNRTYELLQDGERAVNTYKKLTDEGRSEEAEDFLNNNLQRYELGKMSSSFKNAIKYIDDEAKNVRQSDSTPAEKRERLDELRKEKIDIAKRYREAIRQAA